MAKAKKNKPRAQPPVDNDHVEPGATQFTEAEIAANAEQPAPPADDIVAQELSEDEIADQELADEGPEIPDADPVPEAEQIPANMDEMTAAKLMALKEAFGAKTFRVGELRKNRPQVFHMVDAGGHDIAGGTLEELAFLALTFERAQPAAKKKPTRADDAGPDPILKSSKRQPINSLHDMTIVLRDFGAKMQFEKVGDFYQIDVYGQDDPTFEDALYSGTVPLNATKQDLTRFFRAAEPSLSK